MYTSSFHSTLYRDVNARGQIRRNANTRYSWLRWNFRGDFRGDSCTTFLELLNKYKLPISPLMPKRAIFPGATSFYHPALFRIVDMTNSWLLIKGVTSSLAVNPKTVLYKSDLWNGLSKMSEK